MGSERDVSGLSRVLLWDDRNAAAPLEHGVLDLVQALQPLELVSCGVDVGQVDARFAHAVLQWAAALNDDERHALDQSVD